MKNKTLETILDGQFSSIRFGGCKEEFYRLYGNALEFRRTFPDVDLQAWAVLDDY